MRGLALILSEEVDNAEKGQLTQSAAGESSLVRPNRSDGPPIGRGRVPTARTGGRRRVLLGNRSLFENQKLSVCIPRCSNQFALDFHSPRLVGG
jgi:hypothetical protein